MRGEALHDRIELQLLQSHPALFIPTIAVQHGFVKQSVNFLIR
jgi:hypothetical protein